MSGIAMGAAVGAPLVTEWPPDAQTQRTCPPTFTVTDWGTKRLPPDPTATTTESMVELLDTITVPTMPGECGMQW